MNKTAQHTSDGGTVVGENLRADEDGRNIVDNITDLNPGGSDTAQEDSEQMTHGEAGYPGLRPGDPNNSPGSNPPLAGDTDKGDTDSATATGQDGDLSKIEKKKAYNYS